MSSDSQNIYNDVDKKTKSKKHNNSKTSVKKKDVIDEGSKKEKKKKKINIDDIYVELIEKQLHYVPENWKLSINDMKRVCKYIETSIFDKNECCVWGGYITNMHNSNKGTYVNFYFKNKKMALHRLLYSNFVSPLHPTEYLKFNCENKGICCNVNHYEKYKYSKSSKVKSKPTQKDSKKDIKEVMLVECDSSDSNADLLTLDFE